MRVLQHVRVTVVRGRTRTPSEIRRMLLAEASEQTMARVAPPLTRSAPGVAVLVVTEGPASMPRKAAVQTPTRAPSRAEDPRPTIDSRRMMARVSSPKSGLNIYMSEGLVNFFGGPGGMVSAQLSDAPGTALSMMLVPGGVGAGMITKSSESSGWRVQLKRKPGWPLHGIVPTRLSVVGTGVILELPAPADLPPPVTKTHAPRQPPASGALERLGQVLTELNSLLADPETASVKLVYRPQDENSSETHELVRPCRIVGKIVREETLG